MNRSRFVRFAFLGWLCLVAAGACEKQPARAVRVDASAPPVTRAPAVVLVTPAPIRYLFTASSESKIQFVASQIAADLTGSFERFNGTIVAIGSDDPNRASVTVEIDMTSLHTGDRRLTASLKSPALLDVARYPKARFVSTSMRRGGDLGATNTVTGDLELHGVTKAVSVPMTLHMRRNGVDVDAELTINLRDFGLAFRGKRDALVKSEVRVLLVITAAPAP